MIQAVTESTLPFAAPVAVAARDSEGADFEAGLAAEDPLDSGDPVEEDEGDEEAEAAMPEVISLEQFVRKPEIVLTVPVPAGPATPAAGVPATDSEVAPTAAVGSGAAPDATAITPETVPVLASDVASSAASDPRQAAAADEAQKPAGETAPPAESRPEAVPNRERHHSEHRPEIRDAPPNSESLSQVAVQGVDTPNQPTAALVAADVTLHQVRAQQPEMLAQPVPTPRHGLPEARQIARQLARQVSADHDRIEITLTPEELGKVRLVMTPGETPTVSVHADNPATLDLMRRHADVLMRELSDTGFGGASLSFGDGGQGGNFQQAPTLAREGGGDAPAIDKPVLARPVSDRRLDIRI